MLTRDYILRMLESLSKVLQKILLLKREKNFEGAAGEINAIAQKIIGFELKYIKTFSDSKIIELMSLEKDTAAVKLYVVGILLKEDASLMSAKEMKDTVEELNLKSLSMLLESYLIDNRPIDRNHIILIGENLELFKNQILPENIYQKIFLYYENTGMYSKAEDTLFEMIEMDESHAQEGIEFYDRLLKRSDEELLKGSLPRKEVEESLLLLRTKLTAGKN